MVLNQQLSKENSKDFYERLISIIGDWLPYVTNYCELKDKGWYTKYDDNNEYVSEEIVDCSDLSLKQYHHAWSKCPYKKEIVELIKSAKYLDINSALKVFEEVTGIKDGDSTKKDELLSKANELIQKAEELKTQAETL